MAATSARHSAPRSKLSWHSWRGDRQALGPSQSFIVLPKRCCGENARLVKPLPLRGQGLGVSQSQGTSFPADGFHPSHGREAMPVLEMFSGRL